MNNQELLNLYLEKLRILCMEKMHETDISVLNALKESIQYIEGEMSGY